MIEVGTMTEYDADVAAAMGKLLAVLSAKYNGEAVSRELLEEIIESPWHDVLLAFDGDELVGMASMSVLMGTLVQRVAYLEDFVVAKNKQGQGIGTTIWQEIIVWSKKKGCKRLEFTSSGKAEKAGAVEFYKKLGAEVRDTNCFRYEL